jgi:hypothetical protein
MQFRFRSLVQFRLATLLIAITQIGVWLGVWADRANRQKRAVAAIEAAGALIHFDYERDSQLNRVDVDHSPAPQLLRRWMGDDFFRRVVEVDFEIGFDEQGNHLGLTKIDDQGMACLEDLPDVECLLLGFQPGITDAGLAHLRGLRNLRYLDLRQSSVTGTGCAQLASLENLRGIQLESSRLTPAGLVAIGRLQQLEELVLSNTPVTDDSLPALLPLKNLKILRLDKTHVTPRGIMQLQALRALESLDLPFRFTKTEMDQLQQALPHCSVGRVHD